MPNPPGSQRTPTRNLYLIVGLAFIALALLSWLDNQAYSATWVAYACIGTVFLLSGDDSKKP